MSTSPVSIYIFDGYIQDAIFRKSHLFHMGDCEQCGGVPDDEVTVRTLNMD